MISSPRGYEWTQGNFHRAAPETETGRDRCHRASARGRAISKTQGEERCTHARDTDCSYPQYLHSFSHTRTCTQQASHLNIYRRTAWHARVFLKMSRRREGNADVPLHPNYCWCMTDNRIGFKGSKALARGTSNQQHAADAQSRGYVTCRILSYGCWSSSKYDVQVQLLHLICVSCASCSSMQLPSAFARALKIENKKATDNSFWNSDFSKQQISESDT